MKEGGSRAGLQEDGWDGSRKQVKETTVEQMGRETSQHGTLIGGVGGATVASVQPPSDRWDTEAVKTHGTCPRSHGQVLIAQVSYHQASPIHTPPWVPMTGREDSSSSTRTYRSHLCPEC